MSAEARDEARSRAHAELALLDTAPEREFDALAALARKLLKTSISSVTMIAGDRQWFKARCGPLEPETERGPALCNAVVESEAPLLVGDASTDPRFASNPFVVGAPYIRYYAGVPISAMTADGTSVPIGTICVIDDKPRTACEDDLAVLRELACVAEALVEARAVARRAVELAEGRRDALERLERERRQFKKAEGMADMGSWRYDLNRRRTEWSDGVFSIHELSVAVGVPEDRLLDFFPEPGRTAFLDAIMRTLDTGEPFELAADIKTAKGNGRRVRCMGEIELSKGKPVAIIGLIQDITEQHRMERALLHSARTDDLTQLPNRAEFNRVLDDRLKEAHSFGGEIAVLLLDLDGFKGVNDTLGHAAGDDVLRKVADRLRADHLGACFAARLGGDEFGIVVPRTVDKTALDGMVDRLLRDLHVVAEGMGRIVRVTGTIGVALAERAGYDRERIIRHADAALYDAKRIRKGTARTYEALAQSRLAG